MKKILFILIPIYIVIGSMGISVRASADEEIFLLKHGGKNNYMEFVVKAGQQGTIDFELCNISGEKKTNYVLVYDSMTAINGGNIIMTPDNLCCNETASWFEVNSMEVVLESGQTKAFSTFYNIPKDIPDGVYTAILALYAYSTDTSLEGEDVNLKIDSNYTSTIAIIFRVGKDSSAEFRLGEGIELISEGSTGNSYMLVPIENYGSDYGFPTLEYSIFDDNGIELQSGSMKLDIFYRLTSSKAAVLIEKGILTTGSYKADVKILTSNNSELQDSASYLFEMDDKTMKEVIRNRIENQIDNENDSAWKSDFIVLGKQEVILGSAGILGAALISVLLIVLLKGRNRS
ncbi:MAG: hypothetical protein JXN10_02040 [Clostridia bacterium]|nr:hypothetical protein [Clostridia bacterium]MBN2882278.1 hypothetical protein [Clostridia bacterium]